MPGITGIISKKHKEQYKKKCNVMIECMTHESFYNSGVYFNEEFGIYTGWVCRENSFSDCMPVMNEKKDIVLIYTGENFTDLDLFTHLKEKHHEFDRTSADYLVHLYEEKGIDFFQELNGWFSGILIDLRVQKAFLFNDRFGMQRIYYYQNQNELFFSSEAKSLLKICPELRSIDFKGLGELFCCNSVLGNRTLYKNVHRLPGGSLWAINKDHYIERKTYFEPETWENQSWLEKEFFYQKLRKTLRKVLPRYFRGEQQIGISLTGGFDNRMILSNIETPAGKYPCYTFGGIYRDCNDVKVARTVANACKQSHQVIELGRDFLNHFAEYAEKTVYITDGYLDVTGAPEIYVNRFAREIAPIRMTGNYGSELLRSHSTFMINSPNEKLFNQDFIPNINDAKNTAADISGGHPLTFTLFKEAPLREYRIASEMSQLTLRTPYMDNDLVSLIYRAPPMIRDSREISLRLIRDGKPKLCEIMTDRGYGGTLKFPLFIFPRMFHEFFFKAEYYYDVGMPHWLSGFDYLFKPMHFEKFFLGRHKFYHFRAWYRDQLADYVRNIILDDRTLNRPYLNRSFVEKIVHSHTKGYCNFTTEITQLLTVELIQRILIEDS